MLGTNTPHAHLLIGAHADLLRFATRHRLIGDADAAKSERNVAMLREKLGFAARDKGMTHALPEILAVEKSHLRAIGARPR